MLAVNTAGMLVRRAGARGARRARRGAADLRQRHRLRLARRPRRPPHPHRAAGRGVPRRGRPPRAASYAADRAPHPLPGAAGRALHARWPTSARAPLPWQFVRLFFGSLLRVLGFLAVRSVGAGPRRARRAGPVRPRPAGPGRGCSPVAARSCAGGDAARVRHLLAPGGCPTATGSTPSPISPRPLPTRPPTSPSDAATPEPGHRRPAPARSGARRPTTRTTPSSPTPAGRPVLHQPGRARAGRSLPAGVRRGPRGLRSDHRRRARPGPRGRGRLVAAARRVVAPARARAPTCRHRRTSCRSRCSRACCSATPGAVISGADAARVPDRRLGRVATAQGRGPPASTRSGRPGWLLVWGALTYALVPATSGAWGEGRFGTVAVAALLPVGSRTPRWASSTPTATAAGGPRGGRRCCSRSARPSCPGSGSSRSLSPRWSWERPRSSPPVSCATATIWGPPVVALAATPLLRGAVVRSAAHDGLRRRHAARVRSPHGRPGDLRRAADRSPQRARRPGVAGPRPRPARVGRPRAGAHPRAGAGLLARRTRCGGRVRHPLPRHGSTCRP